MGSTTPYAEPRARYSRGTPRIEAPWSSQDHALSLPECRRPPNLAAPRSASIPVRWSPGDLRSARGEPRHPGVLHLSGEVVAGEILSFRLDRLPHLSRLG